MTYGFLFRPKWIAFHLLVAAAVALMVWLGFWQLRRLDERREFNDRVAARIDEPPVPLDQLLDEIADDPASVEWRQVTTEGTWLADQVIWYNRSQDGLAGDNVLTALVTEDGTTVVVNRGFVPLPEDIPAAPGGEVDVLARVRLPQVRATGQPTEPPDGAVTEVRRVDLDQLAAQLPGEVPGVYLDVIATEPPVTEADPTPVPVPESTEGSHLSYAVQWFIFAACVVVGWVFAVRRSIASRRPTSADGDAADQALSGTPAPPSDGTARPRSASGAPDRSSGTPSRR